MIETKFTRKLAIALALVTVAALCLTGCGQSASPANGGIVDINAPQNSSVPNQPGVNTPGAGTTPADPAQPVELAPTPDPNMPANDISIEELDGTEDADKTPEPVLSYNEYRSLNSDVIGWIKIGDTNVDYPLLHSHDNKDYLTRSPTLSASKSGSIFLDYRCDTSSRHMIIYGHNMSKSKTMFAQVTNYGNRSFYDAHRTFELTIGDTKYNYKVFSVYSVDVNDAKYMVVNFDNDDQFTNYINNTLGALSQFPVDTTIGAGDKVVTLSTCTHTDYANGRFVVHAVRVD